MSAPMRQAAYTALCASCGHPIHAGEPMELGVGWCHAYCPSEPPPRICMGCFTTITPTGGCGCEEAA